MSDHCTVEVKHPNHCQVDDAMLTIQKPLLEHVVYFLKKVYKDRWWDKVVPSFSETERERVRMICDDSERVKEINDNQKLLKIITYHGYDYDYKNHIINENEKHIDRRVASALVSTRNDVEGHAKGEITREEAIGQLTNIMNCIKDLDKDVYAEIEKKRSQLINQHNQNTNPQLLIRNEPFTITNNTNKSINNNSESRNAWSIFHSQQNTISSQQSTITNLSRIIEKSNIELQKFEMEVYSLKQENELLKRKYDDTRLNKLLNDAQNGILEKQYELSQYYASEEVNDLKKSWWWLQTSANGGYAPSQFDVSMLYYNGYKEYVEQSYEKAFEWSMKAAEQGHVTAQYNPL